MTAAVTTALTSTLATALACAVTLPAALPLADTMSLASTVSCGYRVPVISVGFTASRCGHSRLAVSLAFAFAVGSGLPDRSTPAFSPLSLAQTYDAGM